MKKTQSANFAQFEVLNETAQGTMVGGFSFAFNATVNLLEGSNNCQGGNCVEGCGKGQNVSACNSVSGCGVKA